MDKLTNREKEIMDLVVKDFVTTVELEKQGIRPITVYNPKTNKDDLKFIKR